VKPILEIQNISKRFKIHHQGVPYLSFRDRLTNAFSSAESHEDFWALNDVSFNVAPGESVGIIGRNGAGKSTLLKILSRITPPTKGKILSRGRIASLLEVGTGFHQELTGRENIFMNGSILGMKRKEIVDKFDEIVDFAGTENFLDTALKHYSSGMQLRLAFAVAAYLEPEILILDEVLAVGDSVFQKKCLQKMAEVSASGRTILFVSHNLQALKNLCSRAVLLKNGTVSSEGNVEDICNDYLQSENLSLQKEYDLSEKKIRKGRLGLRFTKVSFNKQAFKQGDSVVIKLELSDDGKSYKGLRFGINFLDSLGNCIIHLSNIFIREIDVNHTKGANYEFELPDVNLRGGLYTINIFLSANEEIQDWIDSAAQIEIQEGNIYEFEDSKMIQGMVQPNFKFKKITT
jgi:lipopolysaccharide transport system ATP-binding protein